MTGLMLPSPREVYLTVPESSPPAPATATASAPAMAPGQDLVQLGQQVGREMKVAGDVWLGLVVSWWYSLSLTSHFRLVIVSVL